jgi:spore maturation protein SpmB
MVFLVIGALRKVKVYEAFVEGAKEGFDVAKNLLPYLVAMLCAVGVLRASGALDLASTAFAIWWPGPAWTRASSMRCRPRWSSRSLAARRGRC